MKPVFEQVDARCLTQDESDLVLEQSDEACVRPGERLSIDTGVGRMVRRAMRRSRPATSRSCARATQEEVPERSGYDKAAQLFGKRALVSQRSCQPAASFSE